MSSLCRFKIGDVWHKARIFERASNKRNCSCCGERKFGILVRHSNPDKKDTLICDECIIKLSLGQRIDVPGNPDVMFGIYPRKRHIEGKKRGTKAKAGRRKGMKLSEAAKARQKKKLRATLARKKEEANLAAILPEEPIELVVAEEVVPEEILNPIPDPVISDYDLNKRSIYGK